MKHGVADSSIQKKRSRTNNKTDQEAPKRQRIALANRTSEKDSPGRTELLKMGIDALQAVKELKNEIMLLRQEISTSQKNIHTCCNRNNNIRGLCMAELNLRRKKIPWLHRKVWITYLPGDLMQKILRFLSDEDLFICRGLSTQFYEAFYGQEIDVNGLRCVCLAKRGRQFANLRIICLEEAKEISSSEYKALCPQNFPKLEALCLHQH